MLARIDVDHWGYTTEGRIVEKPKANPQYWYDWSFGTPDDGYVLCIWCDLLDVIPGRIAYSENMQDLARDLETAANDKGLDQRRCSRVRQQAGRARAFDDAVDYSYRKGRPLRVILTAGNRRSRDEIVERASEVDLRSLDTDRWYVRRYSRDAGDYLLVRGVPGSDDEPQPALEVDEDRDDSPGADDARRVREVNVRRGQGEFRRALMDAYSRQCAVTGSPVTDLLEAAHIIPHAEGTNYRINNGLLLRADIHTLFDLYLLSIDDRLNVHIARSSLTSEYKEYHSKPLRQCPDSFRDHPFSASLQTRHERFLARERERL